jgi:SWI/SNF-related matrix-associated actin-dependent regulator 1 of chromatin subfamily A
MSTKLFEFQVEGVAKLDRILVQEDRRAALLADQPGLGKTIQALTAAQDIMSESVLVLCPPTLRSVWRNEAKKHFGFDVQLPKSDKPVINEDGSGWVCVGYSVIWRPSHEELRQRKWDLLICDEAHLLKSYGQINGGDSKVATCVYAELAPFAKKVIMITGTPIKNRVSEFWPLAQLLMPEVEVMKDRYLFARRYCKGHKGRFGYNDSGASNVPELRARMDSVMVRRLKKDVLKDLPAKIISVIELPPSAELRAVIDFDTGEVALGIAAIEAIKRRMGEAKDAGSIDKFKQAQSELKEMVIDSMQDLARMRSKLSIPKAHAAVEYLKILLDGGVESVVVGVWHTEAAEILTEGLAKYGVTVITGETPMSIRDGRVQSFQDGVGRVFVGQILAAGVGITLTRASYVVMVEVPYSPSELSQFIDRCHRIGQTDSVNVDILAVQDSPDSHVMKSLAKKVEVIAALMDGRTMKEKRQHTRIEARVPLPALGQAMSRLVREFCHWHVYKLNQATEKGGVADGKGFSGADEAEGRRLAGLKGIPTDVDFGSMAVIVARHRAQITDKPEMMAIVLSLVTGGQAVA